MQTLVGINPYSLEPDVLLNPCIVILYENGFCGSAISVFYLSINFNVVKFQYSKVNAEQTWISIRTAV